MVQLARDQLPALVQTADEVLGRNSNVIKENRIDVVIRQQLQWINANALGLHIDKEHRQAAMLRRLLVGSHRQPAIVRIARQARPKLRTVNDVVAASVFGEIGSGLQSREVRSRLRFAVPDTKMHLASEHLG